MIKMRGSPIKEISNVKEQKMLCLTILAIAAIAAVVAVPVFGMLLIKAAIDDVLEEFR